MSVTNLFNDDDPTIASRYLAGQLTDAERAAYEAELEKDSKALRELEATARLKVGLERLRETGQLDDMLRPTSTGRQILVGLAATVAIAVIGASFFLGYFRDAAQTPLVAGASAAFMDGQGNALTIGPTVAVFRKRQGEFDATVDLPQQRQVIVLRALPQSAAPADRYRVSLGRMRDDGTVEPSQSVAALHPAEDGFVTVFVDSSLLAPGRYRMTVSATDGAQTPESFLIQVNRAAND